VNRKGSFEDEKSKNEKNVESYKDDSFWGGSRKV
jgi:hypothetical protein